MSATPRTSRARSAAAKQAVPIDGQYNRIGLTLAIFSALCFFLALWGLNGYFTASTVLSLGKYLGAASVSWGTGWLVHIVTSLIEHHLHRVRGAVGGTPSFVFLSVYGLILFVGALDVLTSALAFLFFFNSFGFNPTDPTARFVSVVLAEVIAILPESLIVW